MFKKYLLFFVFIMIVCSTVAFASSTDIIVNPVDGISAPATKGDLNDDGYIDSIDFSFMRRYLTGSVLDSDISINAADMNGDSIVDSIDGTLLRRNLTGNNNDDEYTLTVDVKNGSSVSDTIEVKYDAGQQVDLIVEIDNNDYLFKEWQGAGNTGNTSTDISITMDQNYNISAVFELINDDQTDMRDMTTMEIVHDMGIGWNLGNTLESTGDWINGTTVSDYEVAWGSPIITEEMIVGIKDSGFNSVRIPVAWSNLMAEDYTIDPGLMDRVEEIVNYVLDNDMYAIVNIHWDGGWIHDASTDYDGTLEKFEAIWEQVSERFRDYSDYLIFESMNEEGVFDDVWNRYSNEGNKTEAYDILNDMNQEFVDLVRASGGNNEERHLLIAGYATDIDLTIDSAFRMPSDPQNRMAVSVHYYTPSTFTILTEDASWGQMSETWGTESEIDQLKANMQKMKTHFVDQGIPVIIGEYGTTKENKDPDSVNKFLLTVTDTAYHMGMLPMLWDIQSDETGHYNRETCSFYDSELAEGLKEIANSPR